jgi:hypothetical protein
MAGCVAEGVLVRVPESECELAKRGHLYCCWDCLTATGWPHSLLFL